MVWTDLAGDVGLHGGGAGSDAPLAEHAMVRLSVRTELADGRCLPAGARGAVVLVHGEGAAYEVEFLAPFHALATVPAADLTRADGA